MSKQRKPRFRRRAFCQAVNKKRKKLDMSWRAVARELGVFDMVLHRMQDLNPSLENYLKLTTWLGVSPNKFIFPERKTA